MLFRSYSLGRRKLLISSLVRETLYCRIRSTSMNKLCLPILRVSMSRILEVKADLKVFLSSKILTHFSIPRTRNLSRKYRSNPTCIKRHLQQQPQLHSQHPFIASTDFTESDKMREQPTIVDGSIHPYNHAIIVPVSGLFTPQLQTQTQP